MTARLLAALLIFSPALGMAAEPQRVELEIKRPEATAVPLAPAAIPSAQGQALQTPSLPEIPSGLAQGPAVPSAAAAPAAAQPAAEAQVWQGQARFDLAKPAGPSAVVLAEQPATPAAPASPAAIDALVRRTASRRLEGVFIQQEQEGSLLAADPRDSSGDVFKYYRPVEMRPDLMAEVQKSLSGGEKLAYGLKRAFNFWDKKDAFKVWKAWPVTAKLAYLGRLEAAVTAQKGKDAAWKGKVSLILERENGAPEFLTRNPHMESPPAGYEKTPGARFLQPELVSDKDKPAATISEAIGRTKMLIAETGHAGTQYHVFVKADRALLEAQLPRLLSALQLVNNALFAKAAQESFQNVEHASLLPWHSGRSLRVADLIAQGSAQAHTPEASDPDSEKHAFVGLRYWGTEDGKLVISFELRGAGLPWKQPKRVVREMETSARPERDYSQIQRYLTLLSLYAERLNRGRAPAVGEPAVELDLARAETLIRRRAEELRVPADAYYGLEEFGKRLSSADVLPQGYLFAFAVSGPASPALRELIDELINQSARVRALERSGGALDGERRNIQYMFWSAYREWALQYEVQERARLDALFGALSS